MFVTYREVRDYLEGKGFELLRNWPRPVFVFVHAEDSPIVFASRDKRVRRAVYNGIRRRFGDPPV